MKMSHLVGCCTALALSVSLAGCHLYFGPNEERPWEPPPCEEQGTCEWTCTSDWECAAGCYCEDANRTDNVPGYCVETGFCNTNSDCESGLICDQGTCKPEDRPGCTWDGECPSDQVCDVTTGACVPPNVYGCTSDDQCAAGCYCDEATGVCAETAYCQDDSQCGPGFYCDEPRSTCMPGTDPNAPSCAGTITCTTAAPRCQAGQVPLIVNGCYTGTCQDIDACTSPPVCEVINDETHCLDRADCAAYYNGRNCTDPNGASCRTGDSNCTCETFVFAGCEADGV